MKIKEVIKERLKSRGLYYPLKYSSFFRVYQWLFKRKEIKREKREIVFYKSFLSSCNLIFDIGAYDGHKTLAFLVISKKVVCCEPDSENFKILQTRFSNNKKRVFLENVALSDKEGVAELYIHHPASAFNTLSKRWMKLLEEDNMEKWDESIKFTNATSVQTTTLDSLINKYGVPDFVKIDVEGFEQWVLKGLTHRISYLSFETLLPDYANELHACLSSVENLDPSATYNIARNEKIIFPEFVSRKEIEQWFVKNSNALSFEVVVKMSK